FCVKIEQSRLRSLPRILHGTCLALLLPFTVSPAAPADQSTQEKPRSIVVVFRIDGPVTEVPADDAFQMFSPPGTSLKDLAARLRKAATDPAVKAVVVLPESEWLDLAQVEELRAALALIRKEGKDIFVHADSLAMNQ